MFFASDNTSGVPVQVLDALARANEGYAPGYGADDAMTRVTALIREVFEAPEAAVYLVATGTAANALALATHVRPWQTIYCSRVAHIEEDECAAPEFYAGGAKLTLLEETDGKIAPETLARVLNDAPQGVHHVQRGIVSLTNLTERGARYSAAEIAQLAAIARAHGLPVHLDGARFANALVAEGCTPAEMSWRAGVDVLSFGGTKNGLLGVEAVILFDPAKAWEFELRRKRGGHLFSKHRYLSAQMEAYLTDGLWLDLARQANAMGARLHAGVEGAGARLVHPRGGNMLFVEMTRDQHAALRAAGAVYYDWPAPHPASGPGDQPLQARLVTSWSTTEADIGRFVETMQAAR
ncbi:MAG: beta-eliminating lyase-related protein [Pararhodobacter sp.]